MAAGCFQCCEGSKCIAVPTQNSHLSKDHEGSLGGYVHNQRRLNNPAQNIGKSDEHRHSRSRLKQLRKLMNDIAINDIMNQVIILRESNRDIQKDFFGRVCRNPSGPAFCYVSFPGRFQRHWESFISSENNLSIACVWIPNQHVDSPVLNLIRKDSTFAHAHHNDDRNHKTERQQMGSGYCAMCSLLYGGQRSHEKGTDCLWFLYWIDNVKKARQMNQELVVIIDPSCSVGRSQQLEIVWLELNGYEYRLEDIYNRL